MGHRFVVPTALYRDLQQHLLQGEPEEVAFVFADVVEVNASLVFKARELYLVPPADLETQLPYHVSLTDDAQARVIKAAWDKRTALVELHAHTDPRYPAKFSPSDLAGLAEFVPHVRWRLKGLPYLAMVVSHSGFDALVWRDREPEPLDALDADGYLQQPTGLTITALRKLHGYGTI